MTPEDNVQALWQKCMDIFREKLTPTVYDTWFVPIVPLSYTNKRLSLNTPSMYFITYIKENYYAIIVETVYKIFGKGTFIECIGGERRKDGTVVAKEAVIKDQLYFPDTLQQLKRRETFDSHLHVSYTFDNFIEGKTNQMARNVGLDIAKKLSKTTFNPFFIYGGSGVGKSHLVNAIGNQTLLLHPRTRVLFVSANVFKSQYQEAALNNRVPEFLAFYQSIDVLIIDDIQYLGNTQRTQETFFHLFNTLHQNNKNIIFTSDKPPHELNGIEDRMLTRFKWGLTAKISHPDTELRRNILLHKMQEDGIVLEDEIVEYIVENVRSNVREIEGVLASLLAHATLTDNAINLTLTRQIVSQIVKYQPKQVSDSDITIATCNYYHISFAVIQSKSRDKEVTLARQIIIYLLKKYTDHSTHEIGSIVGKRSHTVVLYAVKEIQERIKTDVVLSKAVADIEKEFSDKSFLKQTK